MVRITFWETDTMTPAEYAQQIITDTLHMRPSDAGYVRNIKAESGYGTFWLELTSDRVYMGTPYDTSSEEANDFLLDAAEALDSLQTLSELASVA